LKRRIKKPADSSEREVLDLVEEAVRLLRTKPLLLAPYYIGAIPFVLGLLYFWSDMVRGAQAHSRLAGAAMTMTLLFAWMKTWQSVFMVRCRAELGVETERRSSFSGWLRTASLQLIVQASGFFILPLSAMCMIPFGWAYAFYQNYSLMGTGAAIGMRQAIRDSVRQSQLWVGQNHRFLAIFIILAFILYLNLSMLLGFLPVLLKIMIGTDSEFTRSSYSTSNTTFMLTTLGLVYLALDPVIKVFYVLRCFLGDSRATGEDILAGIRALPPSTARLTLSALAFFLALASPALAQDNTAEPPPAVRFDAKAFDQSVERVLEKREFSWRLPREEAPRERNVVEEFLAGILDSIWDSIAKTFKMLGNWLKDWLDGMDAPNVGGAASTVSQTVRVLAYGFIVMVILIGLIFFIRLWKQRPIRPIAPATTPTPKAPDLNDEHVDASQLEDSEWYAMAQKLIGEGNLRLALRALYLASLSGLAEREWIRTARHKSNMDYQTELERRTHHAPELAGVFAAHVLDFERVWYGNHEIAQPGIESFKRDYERIVALASK